MYIRLFFVVLLYLMMKAAGDQEAGPQERVAYFSMPLIVFKALIKTVSWHAPVVVFSVLLPRY